MQPTYGPPTLPHRERGVAHGPSLRVLRPPMHALPEAQTAADTSQSRPPQPTVHVAFALNTPNMPMFRSRKCTINYYRDTNDCLGFVSITLVFTEKSFCQNAISIRYDTIVIRILHRACRPSHSSTHCLH
jgi:hypothetical protein